MMAIPLTVVARNEERSIRACLSSLLAASRYACARLPISIEPLVVLDECSDGTEAKVVRLGIPVLHSQGGKVEGQRRGSRPGAFQLFSDADITVSEDCVYALCVAMLEAPQLQVAFPPKQPLPPLRRTPLAWALYIYNLRRGFSSQRTWFSGKLFAIRTWSMPTAAAVAERARRLPSRRFYDYAAPLRVDDILLSRQALAHGGPAALAETRAGLVHFRAPETFVGMYRYYRRLRRELERTDALFPETIQTSSTLGTRRPDQLAQAPAAERVAWHVFAAALWACRATYAVDRAYSNLGVGPPPDPWPSISETKTL